jgi:hypothetical protein
MKYQGLFAKIYEGSKPLETDYLRKFAILKQALVDIKERNNIYNLSSDEWHIVLDSYIFAKSFTQDKKGKSRIVTIMRNNKETPLLRIILDQFELSEGLEPFCLKVEKPHSLNFYNRSNPAGELELKQPLKITRGAISSSSFKLMGPISPIAYKFSKVDCKANLNSPTDLRVDFAEIKDTNWRLT